MEKISFDSVESVNLFVSEGHYLPIGTDFTIGKSQNVFTVIAKVSSGCITITPKLRALDEPKNKREKVKPIPKNPFTAFGRGKVNIYG